MTEQEMQAKAISDSNLVNAWLMALRDSDPAQFEIVRHLPYREQAAIAGLQV